MDKWLMAWGLLVAVLGCGGGRENDEFVDDGGGASLGMAAEPTEPAGETKKGRPEWQTTVRSRTGR